MRWFLILLAGCCTQPSDWVNESLSTGDPRFDSTRLVYNAPYSHIKFELLKTEQETAGYLFLQEFQFAPEVYFIIDDSQFKESIPLREGGMRVKLSSEMTGRLVAALQDRKEVSIMTNGLKEKVFPNQFEGAYSKFLQGSFDPLKYIKGPLE